MGVAKLALRDQLLAGPPAAPAGRRGRARARARGAPARRSRGPPRRHRRRLRLGRPASPAPARCSTRSADAGKRVLLPLVQPDNDLDWARVRRAGSPAQRPARAARAGRPGPRPRRDRRAPTSSSCPGSPSGRDGMRLGRGGGCYDRALDRVTRGTFVCLLLNSEEVLDAVPHEDHDRPVSAVATEDGITRFLRPRLATSPLSRVRSVPAPAALRPLGSPRRGRRPTAASVPRSTDEVWSR